MSIRSHVVGLKRMNKDEDLYRRMVAVWDSCEAAGISIPDEVFDFFDGERPTEDNAEIQLDAHECCTEYSADMRDGFDIEVEKIPPNVKVIRFYNSY